MATCSANDLLLDAATLQDLSAQEIEIVELVLMRNWLLSVSPGADVSIDALLEAGKCYQCMNVLQIEMMELQLLCELSAA